MYHADIQRTDRPGILAAILRGHAISVRSADPEHDLCHAMLRAGLPDAEIQFWRGAIPTLRFRSVHRAAQWRIELGDRFPYRLVRRKDAPLICRGVRQDADLTRDKHPSPDRVQLGPTVGISGKSE
jgi:hypothetical protein